MAMVINSNIMSLNAQRNLTSAQADQNQAMERLTSGKRINSASDDAAGLAISNRMTSQINGLNQAVRNANDGISMIQTAEGALDESTNILQRMRELSVQSANGTYTEGNRKTLDAEVQQLVKELDRISETTSFNGQNILDGSLGEIKLQVGSESNQTIGFEINAMNSESLGLGSTSADLTGDRMADLLDIDAKLAGGNAGTAALTIDEGDVLINGTSIGAFDGGTQSVKDLADQITANVENVTASATNVIQAGTAGDGDTSTNSLQIQVFGVDAEGDGTPGGGGDADATAVTYTISGTTNMDELVAEINNVTNGAISASLDDAGKLVLSEDSGASILLEATGGDLATMIGLSDLDVDDQGGNKAPDGGADNREAFFTAQLSLTSDDGSNISISKGAEGTDTDLANLGFRETTADAVTSIGLDSTAQGTALAAGDVVINGTDIGATTAASGLAGKVDAINTVSGETGVTATITASQSYTFDASITPVEVTAANAYAAGETSYQEVHFATGSAPDFSASDSFDATNYIEFDVDDDAGGGTTTTVKIETDHANIDALISDINSQLVTGGTDVEAFKDSNNLLAFRATATAGDILIDNYAETDAATNIDVGDGNALLGFDIEGLAGSGGSFAGAAVGFKINDVDIDLTTADNDGNITAVEIADAVNTASANTGVTAYVDENDKLHFSSDDAFTLADDDNKSGFVAGLDTGANLNAGTHNTPETTGSLKINGYEISSISLTDLDAAATTINAAQASTGVTAKVDDNGELQLTGSSAITLEAGNDNGIAASRVLGIDFVDHATPASSDGVLASQTVNAAVKLTSQDESPISLELTKNGADATGLKDLNTDLSTVATGSALSNIDISTAAGAQEAIDSIDTALATVNETRSELGAINNRLDFTISNLSSVSENASAARSQIMDADFAAESANLSRGQVLQQAGTAMLAQANAAPQQVLSLLQ